MTALHLIAFAGREGTVYINPEHVVMVVPSPYPSEASEYQHGGTFIYTTTASDRGYLWVNDAADEVVRRLCA